MGGVLPPPFTTPTAAAAASISDLNFAARQRMLSQRMVMQTLLAAQGDARQLMAARSTFAHYEAPHAQRLRGVHKGSQGVNATTTFDVVTKTKADLLFKGLTSIVSDIHAIAREAKVVSFNAQVMAARAGQHGREFAVVANVLSGISTEIDGLSRNALAVVDRNREHA